MSKNPISSFILRIIGITLISSVIWIVAIYYYHEYKIIQEIQTNIERKKIEFMDVLKNYHVLKLEAKKIALLKEELSNLNILFAKLYDGNKKQILDIDFHQKRNLVDRDKIILSKEKLTYEVIMQANKKVYILFQSQINIEDKKLHLVLFLQLDQEIIDSITEDIKHILFIVIFTILLIVITILPIIYGQYQHILKNKNDILNANLFMLASLGNAIAKRDSDTNEHNYRVTYYSIKIAESMNLPKEKMQSLIKGAFLHDIGKIAISDTILLKPSKLTIKEFEIMKTHVTHGVDIVKDIKWLEDAITVIQNHHEKVDGSGYPEGLKKDAIPIEARIFAVADVFDALTSKRPYKEAFGIEKSFTIIQKNSGKHFDCDVVLAFGENYQKIHATIKALTMKGLKNILIKNVYYYFMGQKEY